MRQGHEGDRGRTRRALHHAALTCLVMLLGGSAAYAAPPEVIGYQGQLLDTGGVPLPGPAYLQVRIYDAAVPLLGELPLFVEDHPGVPLTGGVFSLHVGAGLPVAGSLDAALFASGARWLELHVNGERLLPRQPFDAVPYALQATNSSTLGGLTAPQVAALAPKAKTLVVKDGLGRVLGRPLSSLVAGVSCQGPDYRTCPVVGGVTMVHDSGVTIGLIVTDHGVTWDLGLSPDHFVGPGCQGPPVWTRPPQWLFRDANGSLYVSGNGPFVDTSAGSRRLPGSTVCEDLVPPLVLPALQYSPLSVDLGYTFPVPGPLSIELVPEP